MACPLCPAAGWAGGWLGGFFGINPPQHQGGRLLSAAVTASLISVTVIALKAFFNISMCAGGEFTLENIVRVVIKTLVMGIIYSIGVNYLLNRLVFSTPIKQQPDLDQSPPCCCKRQNIEAKD